ncbi:MFS transporter [Corallococcus carmarthensis]|uniref:MFS transporter n=1 Tax=Corallococcus carmarthensis TaxID=2316728 RepID=A0A3A8KS76_9BACT|nr:MFS transporter [Corallococcus carmarthensis]NOK19713.1 MFS transporter [Corallococcus carmarthensis]RKH07101.1 MFS transporter [Corallococcus carmarthensis]
MSPASDGGLSRGRIWQVSLLSTLLIVATLVAASVQASRLFEESLRPDLRAKAETLAETVALQFHRAADLGIPVTRLGAADAYLDDAAAGHEELRYIGFASPEGRLLYASRELKTRPESFFDRVKQAHGQEESRGLARLEGALDLAHPVESRGRVIGQLHLGIDAGYVEQRLQEIHTDILITLFVTALVTIEVLMALMGLLVVRPLRLLHRLLALGSAGDFTRQARLRLHDEATRALAAAARLVRVLNARHAALTERAARARRGGRLTEAVEQALAALGARFRFGDPKAPAALEEPETGDLRLPLFIYLFGSELSRSFWPLYVKRLYQPGPFFSESFMVALPMSLWVTAMVLCTPLGGRLLNTRGSRVALLAGMVPSAFGLALTGQSSSLTELFLWRIVTAGGYGIVTATALLHVARTSKQRHGARSMGVFVGASTAASVCGTAIGGILADRIGYGATFGVAAGLVCLSMVLVGLLTPDSGPREAAEHRPVAAYLGILKRGRVLLFILLAAMPVRLVLTGFLFFLTPLRLHELGFSEAAIGRLMMGSFIATVLATPVVSLLADRYGWHRGMMLAGGGSSGLGVLLFASAEGSWPLLASVLLVGLGQALATTPLLASVPPLFAEECVGFGLDALLSVFRIIERVGSLAGPLLAAALLGASGFVRCAHAIGAGMLVLTAGLAAYLFVRSLPSSTPSPKAP